MNQGMNPQVLKKALERLTYSDSIALDKIYNEIYLRTTVAGFAWKYASTYGKLAGEKLSDAVQWVTHWTKSKLVSDDETPPSEEAVDKAGKVEMTNDDSYMKLYDKTKELLEPFINMLERTTKLSEEDNKRLIDNLKELLSIYNAYAKKDIDNRSAFAKEKQELISVIAEWLTKELPRT